MFCVCCKSFEVAAGREGVRREKGKVKVYKTYNFANWRALEGDLDLSCPLISFSPPSQLPPFRSPSRPPSLPLSRSPTLCLRHARLLSCTCACTHTHTGIGPALLCIRDLAHCAHVNKRYWQQNRHGASKELTSAHIDGCRHINKERQTHLHQHISRNDCARGTFFGSNFNLPHVPTYDCRVMAETVACTHRLNHEC